MSPHRGSGELATQPLVLASRQHRPPCEVAIKATVKGLWASAGAVVRLGHPTPLGKHTRRGLRSGKRVSAEEAPERTIGRHAGDARAAIKVGFKAA